MQALICISRLSTWPRLKPLHSSEEVTPPPVAAPPLQFITAGWHSSRARAREMLGKRRAHVL